MAAMIAVGEAEPPSAADMRETIQRLPLVGATLSLWAYVLQPSPVAQMFGSIGGEFEDTLTGKPLSLRQQVVHFSKLVTRSLATCSALFAIR